VVNTDNTTSRPVDLIFVAGALVRRRIWILLGGLAGAATGLILALVWKPYYLSTAIIMPPQQQQSLASALTAQLPQLAGASSLSLGLKNPNDMYVGIMQGRTVSDMVIRKLQLDAVFHTKLHSSTISKLQHSMTFESSRDGLIRITARSSTPQLAADIVNAYVDALYNLNSQLAITEAGQRRLFFEKQVSDEKEKLNIAEEDLKNTEQKTGMVQLSGQTELLLRQIASVRSEITDREVRLSAMGAFATSENPTVKQIQEELKGLHSQLAQLESKQNAASMDKISSVSSTGEVPEIGLEYLRKQRDVQYHENLFALLSRQLEIATLDEAKSAAELQVIDHAVPADRKAGPSRILIVVFAAILGSIAAAAWTLTQVLIPRVRAALSSLE
jgi:tyrosine-protein kinase Etk/Wzc